MKPSLENAEPPWLWLRWTLWQRNGNVALDSSRWMPENRAVLKCFRQKQGLEWFLLALCFSCCVRCLNRAFVWLVRSQMLCCSFSADTQCLADVISRWVSPVQSVLRYKNATAWNLNDWSNTKLTVYTALDVSLQLVWVLQTKSMLKKQVTLMVLWVLF